MTITLHLSSELETRLLSQAQARGISVEKFLETLIESVMGGTTQRPLTPQERSALFENWVHSHHSTTLPLSDEAISREEIYTREDEML